MTSKAGVLFRLRQCICPDCLCPQSYFAEHDRACVSCRLGIHPAPRSEAQGNVAIPVAAGQHLAPSIRRPDGEERPVATESETELRAAWGDR